VNQISLIGRLTADPEYRAGEKHEAATFRLAISRRARRDGEDAGAVFIDVVAFDGLARTVGDHLAKGRQVAVAGRLEQSEWTTQEGDYRSKHQVIADEVMFLDAPKAAPAEEPEPEPQPAPEPVEKQGYQRKQYRRAG
jgi:single-strand DNA-binding protein